MLKLNFKDNRNKNITLLLNNFYLLTVGISWVFIIIYLRIILERSTYTYEDMKSYISLKHYVIFSFFIIIQIIICIVCIIILIKRKKDYRPATLFQTIANKLNNLLEKIYWKPLQYIHDKVAPHIPGSGRFFLYLETKWKSKNFSYTLLMLFDSFPKVFMAIIFFVEAVFFQRIIIFIYCMPLLFVPICFSVFLKLFISFATRNIPVIREPFITIEGIGDPIKDINGQIVDYPNYKFILKKEYLDVIDPLENINALFQVRRIIDIVVFTKETLSTISPYILLITSSLYLLGGIYRLIILM